MDERAGAIIVLDIRVTNPPSEANTVTVQRRS